ncbi:ABC transporter permease [Kitasatospora sp. NPDC017646]|uniref:ABC transporter permease n=1 Tax=Kitasatospora sp. NPDC017646 TaxID=3364024 RepID=UPI00379C92A7
MIKASIRNFLAHKSRMALSTLAVLRGVAFVSDTINIAFTKTSEIVLDQASAQHRNIHLGDPLRILTPTGSVPGTLVGIVTYRTGNPGVTMAYVDTTTAQKQLLRKSDQFTGITVDTAPGTSHTTAQTAIKTALGDGYSVATKEQQAATAAQQISSFLSVVTTALLGFAGLAVLVGTFLILNTFSMLVAQRTRELGLLRALGASRSQVLRSVLTEALFLGVIGSTLGLGAGIGLAAGLKSLISGFGVDLSGTTLVINPVTPAAAYAVGVLVTLVAPYLPARRAARISPMAALREAATPPAPKLGRRTGRAG